ncbi:MAG: pyridoxamine 5'-phosphate oxidase family protein [Xanthobacteraceae bacterium]
MAFSQTIKDLITNAWSDDCVCLLGTIGKDGPNISPKGSMIVFDDNHLAYWERSRRKALDNVQHDPHVVVIYSNMKMLRDGPLKTAALRFYGTAAVHESGPIKDAIFAKLLKREQEHDGADKGVGVLIALTRAETLRGDPIN